jgi:hypothetical protein
VRPREIFRCKADSGNRQKETLINEASSQNARISTETPDNMLRGFLSTNYQEILLHSQLAKLAEPNVLRENWYLQWEQSKLVRGFGIRPIAG